jgi:uncharacterized coiled-coil protein SlyX
MDSFDLKDIREYARKQLVLSEFQEPETDKEKAMLEQSKKQAQEPDANMVLAMAEMKKGEAAEQKNQIEAMKVQVTAQNEQMKRMIDEFKAATERFSVQVQAQEAGASIDYKRVDTMGKEIDNVSKIKELGSNDTIPI